MATITSVMPRRQGPEHSCIWCSGPTDVIAFAPYANKHVPLHILCGAQIVMAFDRLQQGRVLNAQTMARLHGYRQRLLNG